MRVTIFLPLLLPLSLAAPQNGALPIPGNLLTLIPPNVLTAIPPELITAVPIDIITAGPTDLAGIKSFWDRITADVGGLTSINLPAALKPTTGPLLSNTVDSFSVSRDATTSAEPSEFTSGILTVTTTTSASVSQETDTQTVEVTATSESAASQTSATAAATSSSAAGGEVIAPRGLVTVIPAVLGFVAWLL